MHLQSKYNSSAFTRRVPLVLLGFHWFTIRLHTDFTVCFIKIQSPEPGLRNSLQLIHSLVMFLRAVRYSLKQQDAMFALPQLLTQVSWIQGHAAALSSELSYEIHC